MVGRGERRQAGAGAVEGALYTTLDAPGVRQSRLRSSLQRGAMQLHALDAVRATLEPESRRREIRSFYCNES